MGMNEDDEISHAAARRLGRLPLKTTRKALQFSDFFKFVKLPKQQVYWTKKTPLPLRTFGNTQYGDCTRAKQAVAIMRMERLETRRAPEITDEEVIARYVEMSNRRYGGGDNGAYETDALDDWRNPETTIRDTAGHHYTIDAYLRINASDHDEVKAALALAGAKGIAVCLNLPAGFSNIDPPEEWDIPKGSSLIGQWMPGSWGGHSMWAHGYTTRGIILDHTWGLPNNVLTWDAAAAYLDEAHLVIDSIDSWRQIVKSNTAVRLNMTNVVDAVNAVSNLQIEV